MNSGKSNIYTLMQDMAEALRTPGMIMLGGGSPALIEKAIEIFQSSLLKVAKDKELFKSAVCQYSDSAGDVKFRELLADYLNKKQDWKITKDNILVTSGSQSAFKMLFEYFTQHKGKIIFPLIPDYIGYGILAEQDMLGIPGKIKYIDHNKFRYQISDKLQTKLDGAGALCISRPCNPTGGMLEDSELSDLIKLAQAHNLNLILDNAYGQPLPNIVYKERSLPWAANAIYCLSLSKLGMPGTRTGIVIGNEQMISTLAVLNARNALAPGGVGPAMASVLIENSDLDKLLNEVINPWYAKRKDQIVGFMDKYFADLPVRYHEVDGGFFNWIFCPQLNTGGHELYETLKKNKVVVVPGYAFAPGLKQHWPHLEKCFRISTGQPLELVERGISKIAKVLTDL